MNTLIRIVDGRETPAPGRWTIAPGRPVAGRTGRWWRPTSSTWRTGPGQLLITATGTVAFRLVVDTGSTFDHTTRSLTYQSISISPGPAGDVWLVDGELLINGRVLPARSVLAYHGVFRGGPGAIAWLSWHLPSTRIPGHRKSIGRLALSADLNAEAPPELTTSAD